ncbi:MAG TPA: DUF962 domain-containing protein [Polyangia bacterium]|nr:DUF962 domain-containing protein [Polyangia bacterium]
MEKRYASFREFWPFYVREHSHPVNRALHFVGTTLVIGCAVGAAAGHVYLIPAMPVIGYGFAWVGHFLVEKNRPATFKYPLYSLAADFVMWSKIATGKMGEEVRAAHAAVQ